ncbi:TetR family transcriptional regulator [Salinisphaera sp. S4-8]|uniref:TetR/AcrR family transcriptional regulator n=1 Tax=Salinisphaera sp. S4-8 TaxID=633357 RepID=UPI00333E1B46
MENQSRRQAYAEQTREAILDTAHRLFSRQRFSGTSLDAIASQAGVTKGAVYHHFKDKRTMFSVCFERQAEQVANAVAAAQLPDDDWGQVFAQCRAFLAFVLANGRHLISLQEAITVLGWDAWHEIDTRHTMQHIEQAVTRLQTRGQMKPYPRALVINMIYGLLVNAAMNLNALPDVHEASENLDAIVEDMLSGLKS